MRRNRGLVLGTTATLMLALAPATAAQASAPAAGGLILDVSGLPSGATSLSVQLQSPEPNVRVPKTIDYYPLATVPITGKSLTVDIPASRLLDRTAAAQHGNVNLMISALSAKRYYICLTSARLKQGGVTAASVTQLAKVSFPETHAARPKAPFCHWTEEWSKEDVTRIGELHVMDQGGVSAFFNSNNTADNTISVGASSTGAAGTFTGDGTVTLTNSISSGGGFEEQGNGFHKYVDGDIYYAKYLSNGGCGPIKAQVRATSSVGDAFPGNQYAPDNPYNSCVKDSNGHAVVSSNHGHWNDDRSKAYFYSAAASWLDFKFGSSDGYTSDINEGWDNDGTHATWVCGNTDPVQDSSIFWNGWV